MHPISQHFSTLLRPEPQAGAVARALRAVLGAASAFARAFAHRREVKLMLEMDERTLKDIGLVRNDVLGALAEPLSRDPSVLLRLRTVERRALGRAQPTPARRVTRVGCDA